MTESIIQCKKIIQDMYDEFLKEEKRLTEICDGHSVKIDELEHKIHAFRKNEDVDFKVFSPRSTSNVNSEKISELEKEKESLELESRNFSKQLRYYSDKVDRLNEVLILLGENSIRESISDLAFSEVPDEVVKEKVIDPFDELFPSRNENNKIKKDDSNDDVIVDDNNDLFNTISSDGNKEEQEEIDSTVVYDSNNSIVNNSDVVIKNELDNIIHKVEFTEKIVTNDTIRAKLELREIVRLLKDLFK